MIRRMQETAPRNARCRWLVPSYFSAFRRARFRGNYPAYLQTLGRHAPELKDHIGPLSHNLRLLERRCTRMPLTPAHLDITKKNILVGPDGYKIIDWGEFCRAPSGFDYGSILFTALKSNPRRLPDAIGYFHEMALPDDTYLSAYFFFILSILHMLHISVQRDGTREPFPLSVTDWLMPLAQKDVMWSPALFRMPATPPDAASAPGRATP